MDNKKIGVFISSLRKEQGLSQKELAEKLSVTDKAVSKWETGRGIPDVSILQPLAGVFDITVGELLNGERLPEQENTNDEKLIRKLKIKKYIRFADEFIITAIFIWGINLFCNSFKIRRNVLDLYLHQNELRFLSVCTLIFIAITVLWAFTVIISACFKKTAVVIKTIIICMAFSFAVGCCIYAAVLDDSHFLEVYDTPIDTVKYIKYDDFFNDSFQTQITIKDTNEKITENYSAYFDGGIGGEHRFVYTECVTASEYDIIKAHYEQKKKSINKEYTELDEKFCLAAGIGEGCYATGFYTDKDIEIYFIKGTSFYDISISEANINDEKVIAEITAL